MRYSARSSGALYSRCTYQFSLWERLPAKWPPWAYSPWALVFSETSNAPPFPSLNTHGQEPFGTPHRDSANGPPAGCCRALEKRPERAANGEVYTLIYWVFCLRLRSSSRRTIERNKKVILHAPSKLWHLACTRSGQGESGGKFCLLVLVLSSRFSHESCVEVDTITTERASQLQRHHEIPTRIYHC